MRKIVTLAFLLVLGVTASNAQETSKAVKKIKAKTTAASTPKVDGAGMVFVTETIVGGNAKTIYQTGKHATHNTEIIDQLK